MGDLYTLDDEEEPKLSLADAQAPIIPLPPAAAIRAKKADYALGAESPGTSDIFNQIISGAEDTLRNKTAIDEDLKISAAKQDMIRQLAQTRGKSLSFEEMDMVNSLTKTEVTTNPGMVLEQKFATKYIDDVTREHRIEAEHYWALQDDKDRAVSIISNKDFYQKGLDDLHAEWAGSSWLSAIPNYIGQFIPWLPWWRQAQALDRPTHLNLGMGATMRENVWFMYHLPPEQRQTVYKETITRLKETNPLDAITFAQAMVSFPTSDEYLANAMSAADYTSSGSVALKATKLLGLGKKAATAESTFSKMANEAVEKQGVDNRAPDVKLLEYRGSNKFTKQDDLFGERPTQGELFEGVDFSTKPIELRKGNQKQYRDGSGKLRSLTPGETPVSPTGIFRGPQGRFGFDTGAMKQKELNLGIPAHQTSLDLAPAVVKQERHALADAIKAVEGPDPNPIEVLSVLGNSEASGFLGALERFRTPLVQGLEAVAREVPTLANPQRFFESSKVLGREYAQRFVSAATRQGEGLVNVFANAQRLARTTPEALEAGSKLVKEELRKEYQPRVKNGLIDFAYYPAEIHPANVDTISARIVKSDATHFKDYDEAVLWRKDVYELGEKEAAIRQQGSNWYIEIDRHLPEGADVVRDGMLTPGNATKTSMFQMLTNRILSSASFLSEFQRGARNIATHAPQKVLMQLRAIADEMTKGMSKTDLRQVEAVLAMNRDMENPVTKLKGAWYNTAAEYEKAFLDMHGVLPKEAQVAAYDTFRRVSDFDYLMRNIAVYRDKARLGVEGFNFKQGDVSSPWFEGISHTKMPWSLGKADQDAGIWIYNSETGVGKFHYKFDVMADAQSQKEIDALISDKGYRVVQVINAKKHPLNELATTKAGEPVKDQINYVITNTWEKRPLEWHQVDYRPGVHVVYPHEWYVSQTQIKEGRHGKLTYVGDNHALNVETEAQAMKWAERMNVARVLLRDKKMEELAEYLPKNLPFSMTEFQQLFVRSDSPFDLQTKIIYKKAGGNTLDTVPELKTMYDRGNLIDGTRNIHDPMNFMDKAFLMDRDDTIKTIIERGGMKLGPAEQLSPFEALQKALGQGLRNIWMQDYKIQAIESWMKEFGHTMDVNAKTLQSFPTYFLYNPPWNAQMADKTTLAAAKASQRAIVNFIGARSEIASTSNYIKNQLLNSIYNATGESGLNVTNKVGKFTEDIGLSSVKDPVQFMRAVAFHSKLGMFNPVQLLLQMQSINHSIAVTGVENGLAGVAAAVLTRALVHNPAHLEYTAKIASRLGWKKEHFIEMWDLFQKSGVEIIGGTAALRDIDQPVFRGMAAHWLDKGAMFFNGGEQMVQLTAFAAAYREMKLANPGMKFGNREVGKLMDRHRTLAVDMTRDANAAWQSGVMAVPTQFFTFVARMTEQMTVGALHDITGGRLGQAGRLTGKEKLRALATYSVMYGIPAGVGTTVGVLPFYDDIRKEAISRGINMNEGWLKTASEGLYSTMLSMLTGKDTNFVQRMSPGNGNQLDQALSGDKDFIDILFGASGTIMSDVVKSAYPFYHNAISIFTKNEAMPIMASDYMRVLRNASTLDIGTKVVMAAAYGKWQTKSGTILGEADSMDAALAILGLTPQKYADTFLGQALLKEEKKAQDKLVNKALEAYRRGLEAGAAGDHRAMEDYFKQAHIYADSADLNYADQKRLFHRGVSQGQTLKEKIDWDLYNRSVLSRQQDRLKKFLGDK